MFESAIQVTILTITFSCIMLLMSIGFTLCFSIGRILNFCHGIYFCLGGYLCYYLTIVYKVNLFVSTVIAFLAVGAISALIYRFILERLRKDATMVILVTITLSLLILELFDRVFGNQPMIVPAFTSEKFSVAGVVLSFSYIIAGVLSFICIGFLYFFIKKTKTGIAIEAIAQDSEAAELMGVKISSMLILVSFISGAFASLAGILFSQIYSISPIWALYALLYSFVIVILGGLGNIEGSILGSFIFGTILTIVTFFQGPQWSFVVTFILLILILLIKPTGILGMR